jgi:hypothetical protein
VHGPKPALRVISRLQRVNDPKVERRPRDRQKCRRAVCNTVRRWRLRPWYLPIAKGPPINNAGENEEHSPATARRPRSTTPQPRPRRGPPPLRESDRPTLPALQVLPVEQALARTHTDRRRPAVLDPSALPRQRPRPPANLPPCATGYCTSWGPGPVSVEFEVPAPAGADEAGGATWPPHSHDYAPPWPT